MATGIIWARCLRPSTILPGTIRAAKSRVTSIRACLLERGAQLTSGQIAPFEPVPSLEALAAHGALVINDEEERLLLDDCFYLSGEIPRVSSFEKGRPDHLCRPGADQPWEPDPLILDERYVAVNVRDKGLIVFSSCSHAGIVNVLLHARAVFSDVSISRPGSSSSGASASTRSQMRCPRYTPSTAR